VTITKPPETPTPDQADVDALRELLDLMESFSDNDQRARYLLSSDWMRERLARRQSDEEVMGALRLRLGASELSVPRPHPVIESGLDVVLQHHRRCHWLFSDLDPDDAEWFLARAADGDGLSADDPIAALRNRIIKMRVGGGRVNETDALALAINAWNAHRAGERRSKLQLPRGGLTPDNFPEPR
jgi:hypothetical protein